MTIDLKLTLTIKIKKGRTYFEEETVKNLWLMIILPVVILSLTACGLGNANNANKAVSEINTNKKENITNGIKQDDNKSSKVLIVYFSRSSNTKNLAESIQEKVGGQLLEIKTINPYPESYNDTTRQAKQELETGFKPPIEPANINVEEYDTIYIGSPCWWGTIAPPVMTFLSEHDFSGKTVIPFNTHAGTGIGNTVTDVQKLAVGANVLDGFSVRGDSVRNAQTNITNWLKRIGQI